MSDTQNQPKSASRTRTKKEVATIARQNILLGSKIQDLPYDMQNIIYEKTLQRRLKELDKKIIIPVPEIKTTPFSFHSSLQPENRIYFTYNDIPYFLNIGGPQDPNDHYKYTHMTSIVLLQGSKISNSFSSILSYDPQDHIFDLWRCSTYGCLQRLVMPIHITLTVIRRLFPDLDVKTDIRVMYTLKGKQTVMPLPNFLKMVESDEPVTGGKNTKRGGVRVDIPILNLPPYIAPIFMMPHAYIVNAYDSPTVSKQSSNKTKFNKGVRDIDTLYATAKKSIQETEVDDDSKFNERVVSIQSQIAKLYIEVKNLPSLPLTSMVVKDIRTDKKNAVAKLREVLNLYIELHEKHNRFVVDQQLDGLLELEELTERVKTLPTMDEVDLQRRIKRLGRGGKLPKK